MGKGERESKDLERTVLSTEPHPKGSIPRP